MEQNCLPDNIRAVTLILLPVHALGLNTYLYLDSPLFLSVS